MTTVPYGGRLTGILYPTTNPLEETGQANVPKEEFPSTVYEASTAIHRTSARYITTNRRGIRPCGDLMRDRDTAA